MKRLGICLVGGLTIVFVALAMACSKGTTTAPAPQAAAPAQPQAAAPAPAAPPAAPAPAAAPSGAPSLKSGDTNIANVTADVTECSRKDGVLSIKVRLRNSASAVKRVDIIWNRNYESYYVSAASKKYFILKDSDGTYLTPRADGFGGLAVDLDAGGQYTWWAKFPAPPAEVKAVTLYMPTAAPLEDIPVTDR